MRRRPPLHRSGPEGHGPEGHGPEGHGPEGHGPEGHGPEGHGPEGHGPEGHGPEGHGPEGHGPEGHGPEGHGPEGHGPEGHEPARHRPVRVGGRRGPAAPVLALALALGTVLSLLAAGPALAAGYRYWSFWDGAGGRWAYATQGPSTARPADGSVQGFRFAVSKDAGAEAAQPRTPADFAAVCGSTAPAQGRKRVALVVDFGVPADAPAGDAPPQDAPRTACAQVAPDATTAEALAAVAKPLRYNGAALMCAVSGYPKQGCGEPMEDTPAATGSPSTTPPSAASPSAASSDGAGGPSAGLLAGIAAVAALAAAGVWQSRRRNR